MTRMAFSPFQSTTTYWFASLQANARFRNNMFRVVLLLIALVLLVFLQGERQSSVNHTLTDDGSILATHAGNRRRENVSDGITYSRTIVEFPNDGEAVWMNVWFCFLKLHG